MQSPIDEATFLRRPSSSTQPLSRSNLEKFNASPRAEGSRSLFNPLPAIQCSQVEQEVARPQRRDQDGPKLWLSPHTADCFLVIPSSKARPHAPIATSRSNTPEQQAASSPMAISNLVRRESSPDYSSPPQSSTSSRKRSWEASQDAEASSPPRPVASLREAVEVSSLHALAPDIQHRLTGFRLVAVLLTQHADPKEQAKRRRSLAHSSHSQRTRSGSSDAPSDRSQPSGSFSAGSSAPTGGRADVRVFRVHKSIVAQCGLLRDLLEPPLSPRPATYGGQASASERRRYSRSPEGRTSHSQSPALPSSVVITQPEMMLPLVHLKQHLPSRRFSDLPLPTLLTSCGGGGSAASLSQQSPVSPTTPCTPSSSASAGSSVTTVYMPTPDSETIPLLLHYLYHHTLPHLATALERQATSSATAAAESVPASADGDADADRERGREAHHRRLVAGLIANFDYLGVKDREPREWLAAEWKRLSPGGIAAAAGRERRTSLRPLAGAVPSSRVAI